MKIINNMLFANQVFVDIEETKPIAISLEMVDSFKCRTFETKSSSKEVVSVTTTKGEYLIDEDPIKFFEKLQKYEERKESELDCY